MMSNIVVCVLAGVLAGFGTGFAGLSAAVFIAPMLVSLLGVESFSAVGIALASDVLASAASAATYARNKNIDIKRGWVLMVSVFFSALLGTVIARYFTSSTVGESAMGNWLIAATLALGLNLLFFSRNNELGFNRRIPLSPALLSVMCGIGVGTICGFQGTGGGLWMLFVLNVLLGFEFKKAVGTSVCIMTFTALLGAVSHFAIGGMPEPAMLCICVFSTLLAAEGAAMIANRVLPMMLKRITGVLVLVSGAFMLIAKLT